MYRSERAQSEVLGTVLLLGITIAAVTVTVATGSAALATVTDEAQTAGVENGMSQFTSQSSLVALGETDAKRFDLGSVDGGDLRLEEDAGRVEVRIERPDGNVTNESYPLGALVYAGDGREVAVQGGGVWSSDGTRGRMVSPPEYHYRDATLTFPIVQLTGEETVSARGTGVVRRRTAGEAVFPNVSNPLENGTVVVEVRSDYYEGWYDFFSQRAEGEVTKDDANRTATARLVVPGEVSLDKPLSLGSEDTNTDIPLHEDEYEIGASHPSPSAVIDERIENASTNGRNVSDCFGGGTCTAGIYHAGGDVSLSDDVEFDTTGGNVTIAIDGDFDIGGNDLQITDETNNVVKYYVNGSVDLNNPTIGTTNKSSVDAQRTQFYVNGGIAENTNGIGNAEIDAIVYAPNADVEANGNPRLRGAFVFERLDLGGSSEMEYDADLTDLELTITGGPGQNPITYLHVSRNEIEVRFD
ncbi:flagellin N-terminal-like domain-containing protein [Halorubrum aquaticum]|uniref:Flagellin N-terminal-like domain-containing protein n=1 Tax=Halorubrum aquaticum TaxID=387340 RepID=A0A1I3B173_9EURY|nr:archaellin/type IV pilin N-terminal domain-containing protein [Halorubrum aquaticum]SFH55689.1 flagellin N-terminal-like domain-containing protein [Halorubrum aquaticum]